MASRLDKTDKENAPPVFKTKCGRVHVAVFEQLTSNGPMLNVTLKRAYRTESGEFKDSYSFSVSDLDDASRCFADVKTWAKERQTET